MNALNGELNNNEVNNEINNGNKKIYNPIARGTLSIAILCPVCGEVLGNHVGISECPNCGQTLDFSEIIGYGQ